MAITADEIKALAARQLGIRFMLARSFRTPESTREALRIYRENVPKEKRKVIGIVSAKSKDLRGYCIIICRGFPEIFTLHGLGFYPVKKDRANWKDPRIWQADYNNHGFNHKGRNYLNYSKTDNFEWASLDEVIQFMELDAQLAEVYGE